MGMLLLAARWVIAGVFLRSGIAKATSLADFRWAVANYQLLPPAASKLAAAALPFAEIAAGIVLAMGVGVTLTASALALLLAVFALAIAINLARGREFDCGCAGSAAAPRTISWRHVAGNLLLAALAAAVAIAPPAAAELWLGPADRTSSVPGGSAIPILLSVVVGLGMMTLLRSALTIRPLASAARRQGAAQPAAAEPGSP